MITWALDFATAAVGLALVLCVWRLLRGPEATDRVLALDTLYVNVVALVVLLGIRQGSDLFFEAALPLLSRAPVALAAAAVLVGGQVVARYAKHHLPNYGVFDEFRIFVPGRDLTVARVRGVDVAIAICEDLWQEGGPVALTRAAGAELLLVLNGCLLYTSDAADE